MRFPNAFAGVKKIRTAEILSLIAAIALVVVAILSIIGISSAAADSVGGALASLAGVGVLSIGAAVLGIIAFIMNLVGISAASKDEPQFKNAMIAVIVSIVASVVAQLVGTGILKSIVTLVSEIGELCATIFIIQGITSLAAQMDDEAVKARAATILKMIVCVYVLILIADIIVLIIPAGTLVAGIVGLIAAVLSMIQYFFYLGLLKKAVTMLAA